MLGAFHCQLQMLQQQLPNANATAFKLPAAAMRLKFATYSHVEAFSVLQYTDADTQTTSSTADYIPMQCAHSHLAAYV